MPYFSHTVPVSNRYAMHYLNTGAVHAGYLRHIIWHADIGTMFPLISEVKMQQYTINDVMPRNWTMSETLRLHHA